MLGQVSKAKKRGLRVKPTYDDLIAETFKPDPVKYPDRRAEAVFNSHLFGQIRDAIDETENSNQMARVRELGMHRAATQSGQSFHSVAASVPPQPAPSPIIVDHDLQRERFLQEQAGIAQQAVVEAQRQRETMTQQARTQLQYLADEHAAARQMNAQRASEIQEYHVAEIRQLQRHESEVSESLSLRERNAERTLRRQAEENQIQAAYLRGQLEHAEGRLRHETAMIEAAQTPVPLDLRDEASSALVSVRQPSGGSSSSSSSSSSSAAATAAAATPVRPKPVKKDNTKRPPHSTEKVKLPDAELLTKPRQFLIDQLDLRGVRLTKTDRTRLSRVELARRITHHDK